MQELILDEKTYFELPESYEEVTFEQFMNLADCDSVNLKAVSILTRISENIWAESNNIPMYYFCFNAISNWMGKGLAELNDREVNRLTYLSKHIEFADIGEQSVAQYEDLKLLLAKYQTEYEKDPIAAMKAYYPLFVAIYLQPKTSGEKYDYSMAKEMVTQINQLPAPTIIGIVNFFLTKLAVSSIGIKSSALNSSSWWKKLMLALNNYTRRLAFRRHLTLWQGEILKKKITSKN
jgi:hypothetical protein